MVRNQEIIPVDAILINGEEGNIDNSFITGESATISKNRRQNFAGGKQIGSILELEVIKR